MKTFDLYKHPSTNDREAVKIGWSWPGFFFAPIWALYKKLWLFATVASVAWIAPELLPQKDYEELAPEFWFPQDYGELLIFLSSWLSTWIPSIWAGIKGNDMRRTNLRSRGYIQEAAAVAALTPEEALAPTQPEPLDQRNQQPRRIGCIIGIIVLIIFATGIAYLAIVNNLGTGR